MKKEIVRKILVITIVLVVIALFGVCCTRNIEHAATQPPKSNVSSKLKSDQPESLKGIAEKYGFPAPVVSGNKITLKSLYTTMVFEPNSRKLLFNRCLIFMNAPLVKDGDEWSLSLADITKVIDPLLRSGKILVGTDVASVVIDPGHGGNDAGAIGRRKVYEKKVVLDIAKRVKEKLKDKKIAVKLTRENDSALSLSARTAKARQWGADIFVSIHVNSAHNTKATGLETYVIPAAGFPSTAGNNNKKSYSGNKYDKANTLLAYYVHKEMLACSKSADRGIKRARFDVLRDAPCPAILVECGFVSNKAEEEKMLERKYRDIMAAGITRGILTYIKKTRNGD